MQWDWVDLVIIAIVGLSVITGLSRGFIKELIALGVWIVAIWLAFTYLSTVEGMLLPYLHDQTVRKVVAFIAILLATIIAGGVVNLVLGLILRHSGLSGTDRLLGMGFGFVRGVFIVALIMLVLQMAAIPNHFLQQSRLYPKFVPIVNWLGGFMPNLISKVKVLDNTKMVIDVTDFKPAV